MVTLHFFQQNLRFSRVKFDRKNTKSVSPLLPSPSRSAGQPGHGPHSDSKGRRSSKSTTPSPGTSPGTRTGETARWQILHLKPSRSFSKKAVLEGRTFRCQRVPRYPPTGAWQRMQPSPESVASWLAMVKAAHHIGSRADWAIRLPTQPSHDSGKLSRRQSPCPAWQVFELESGFGIWTISSGWVSGRKKSPTTVGRGLDPQG